MSLKNKKILITCGPTWIPIDDTRIISNKSTGQLGEILAAHFSKAKADITLLEGPVTKPIQSKRIKIYKFRFYDEFLKLMHKHLQKRYDVIVHAAAVSDFKLRRPFTSKISSKATLKLEFVQTKKIINLIKQQNPNALLVGFKLKTKLTKNIAIEKCRVLFEKAKCDLVIANSVANQKYNGYILDSEYRFLDHKKTREGMAKGLVRVLNEKLKTKIQNSKSK